ncbi:MAG: alpha/beta hydrolase [Actinobacteria bacterium]|nr:alpha/beta hydrolase [Actinomycetota bacterium]
MTSIATNPMTVDSGGLFWEARGSGPPVLLVPGTPGDGGQFVGVSEDLADDHLVISYDRRGTSRSSRSADWTVTSVAEQADDAAGVLSAVGVGPAVVFGTSNGAAVALELALRHPRQVAGVMLHEMPLLTVLRDPEPVTSAIGSLIGGAMTEGGPAAALEAFLRFAFGDAIVAGWPAELRERMLSNAEIVFSVEFPAFQSYRPDPDALGRCQVSVRVLVGEQQELPFFQEAAQWLAAALGTDVDLSPGAHGPQFSCPGALSASIREFSLSVFAAD